MDKDEIIRPVGKLLIGETKPNYNVCFHRVPNNEFVGKLDFTGPTMTFEGDADESANIFFNFLAVWFAKRLEEERAAEREACAKVCEALINEETCYVWIPDARGAVNNCAAAIRARNNNG